MKMFALWWVVIALLAVAAAGLAADFIGWEWAARRCEGFFSEVRDESGV